VTTTRLLVVDDDAAITQIYGEVLRGQGYDVLIAGSCAQALSQMDGVQGNVQVQIIDLGLPDGDGAQLVHDTTAKYGSRPTLYVSGWHDEFWQMEPAPGQWIILRKPIPIPRLLAAVKWLAFGGAKPPELDE
jgi:two-component system, OmpR family, KDP operon response regulator KdpE